MIIFDLTEKDKIENNYCERISHELWIKGIHTYIHHTIPMKIENTDLHIFYNILIDWVSYKFIMYLDSECEQLMNMLR